MFEGIPFEDLVSAMRRGECPEVLDKLLTKIVERVSKAIGHRFPDSDYVPDAVQSALRTFFRRIQNGKFKLDGQHAMESLLVVIASRKAVRLHRDLQRRPAPLDDVAAELHLTTSDGGSDSLPQEDAEDERRKVREFMAAQLAGLVEKVEESLTCSRKKRIWQYWFAKEFEGRKITEGEIAKEVGCSRSTVDRDIAEITEIWQPLLQEALRAIREFRQKLAEGEGNHHAKE